MFKNFVNPLTTATSVGVGLRYLTTIVGSVLTILGVMGLLSSEQVEALAKQVPELLGAIGAVITLAIPIYAMITKSSSDKAATVAKEVDKEIPVNMPVRVQTPEGQNDLVVTPEGNVFK